MENAAKLLKEVQRVLRTGGIYLMISYGAPECREELLKQKHLKFVLEMFEITQIDEEKKEKTGSGAHYCYISVKANGAEENCKKNWDSVLQKIREEASKSSQSSHFLEEETKSNLALLETNEAGTTEIQKSRASSFTNS